MKFGKSLLARLGLYTCKVEAPDLFAVRLERIGVRERRCAARTAVFRTPASHPAV